MSRVETAPLVAGEVEEGPSPVQPPPRPSAAVVKRTDYVQLLLLAGPAVGLLVLAARFGGPIAGLDSLLAPVLVLATVGIGAVLLRSRAGRVAVGHSHDGPPGKILRHEGAHLEAADRIGAPVKCARFYGHSGFVRLADAEALSSRDYMAFQLAGRYGAGSRSGCGGDDQSVADEERRMRRAGVRPAEVRRTRRLADGDARRYGSSAGVARWAAKLGKRGKL